MKIVFATLAFLTLNASSIQADPTPTIPVNFLPPAAISDSLQPQLSAVVEERLRLDGLSSEGALAITVQHVPVNIMAWWLDPKHNTMPSNIDWQWGGILHELYPTTPYYVGSVIGPTNDFMWQTIYSNTLFIPGGVKFVVPDSENRCLLVKGTSAALESLATSIGALDKPLQSVEVEIKIVNVRTEDLDNLSVPPLPIVHSHAIFPFMPESRKARAKFEVRLQSLVADKRAQVLYESHARAYSGVTVQSPTVAIPPHTVPFGRDALQLNVAALVGENGILKVRVPLHPYAAACEDLHDGETYTSIFFVDNEPRAIAVFVTPHIIPQSEMSLTH